MAAAKQGTKRGLPHSPPPSPELDNNTDAIDAAAAELSTDAMEDVMPSRHNPRLESTPPPRSRSRSSSHQSAVEKKRRVDDPPAVVAAAFAAVAASAAARAADRKGGDASADKDARTAAMAAMVASSVASRAAADDDADRIALLNGHPRPMAPPAQRHASDDRDDHKSNSLSGAIIVGGGGGGGGGGFVPPIPAEAVVSFDKIGTENLPLLDCLLDLVDSKDPDILAAQLESDKTCARCLLCARREELLSGAEGGGGGDGGAGVGNVADTGTLAGAWRIIDDMATRNQHNGQWEAAVQKEYDVSIRNSGKFPTADGRPWPEWKLLQIRRHYRKPHVRHNSAIHKAVFVDILNAGVLELAANAVKGFDNEKKKVVFSLPHWKEMIRGMQLLGTLTAGSR